MKKVEAIKAKPAPIATPPPMPMPTPPPPPPMPATIPVAPKENDNFDPEFETFDEVVPNTKSLFDSSGSLGVLEPEVIEEIADRYLVNEKGDNPDVKALTAGLESFEEPLEVETIDSVTGETKKIPVFSPGNRISQMVMKQKERFMNLDNDKIMDPETGVEFEKETRAEAPTFTPLKDRIDNILKDAINGSLPPQQRPAGSTEERAFNRSQMDEFGIEVDNDTKPVDIVKNNV